LSTLHSGSTSMVSQQFCLEIDYMQCVCVCMSLLIRQVGLISFSEHNTALPNKCHFISYYTFIIYLFHNSAQQ